MLPIILVCAGWMVLFFPKVFVSSFDDYCPVLAISGSSELILVVEGGEGVQWMAWVRCGTNVVWIMCPECQLQVRLLFLPRLVAESNKMG